MSRTKPIEDVTPDFQAPFMPPAGATQLVLVRHGASRAHEPGATFAIVDGYSDPPLSPRGHDQALAVAARLSAEPVTALFVTSLQRTMQTAAPLAERLAVTPTVVDELREVHLGEWECDGGLAGGGPVRDAQRERVLLQESWSLVPGGEGSEAFATRVRAGLERIAALTGPDRLGVAVIHGGVIAEVCRQLTASRPFAFFAVENASITRLICQPPDRWTLQVFNDTAHLQIPLQDLLATRTGGH
jgi:probable phosphoglycerate mutase